MQNRKWLYYLLDEFGKSYRIENGLVVAKNDPYPLRYTPDGWQDISIAWERSFDTYGTVRNFTLPYNFVRDGLEILRELFYTKNFDHKLFLLLKKQELFIDNNEFYFWHKYFYKGQLDLVSMKDEANRANIEILEGGLHKDMDANKATTYEFPLSSPEAVIVKMDGVDLIGKQNMSFIEETGIRGGGEGEGYFFFLPLALLAEEGKAAGVTFLASNYEPFMVQISDYNFVEAFNYFAIADKNNVGTVTVKVKGTVKIKMTLKTSYSNLRIKILKVNDNSTNYITLLANANNIFINTTQLVNVGDMVSIDFDFDIPMAPGERLFMYADYNAIAPDRFSEFEFLEGSNFIVQYVNRYRTTFIRAFKPATIFYKLMDKISGSSANGVSSLLESKPNLAITSGDGVRGLPGSVLKTNFNNFFEHHNVILNAGYSIIQNKLLLEKKERSFVNADPIHLGKIKEPIVNHFKDVLCNTLRIGYPNQQYEDVNGKQEFNTSRLYSSPVKGVVKELTLVSPYRADCFGIEYTRINLEGKTTTDDSSDNDVFVINIDYANPQTLTQETDELPAGTIYYNLKRRTYDSIEGLLQPANVFNIEELTPARLIKIHENWLRSIFHGFESGYLEYRTTDKNSKLKTVKGSEVYDEDADIQIQSLKNPLVIPRIIDFKTLYPVDLVETMEANPNRCFSFEHPNGKIYKGFNVDVGIAPNTMEEQAYRLIFTPDTDLTTLRNAR